MFANETKGDTQFLSHLYNKVIFLFFISINLSSFRCLNSLNIADLFTAI